MYMNLHSGTTRTSSHSVPALQRSLPETRVHYCSLTSASRLQTTGHWVPVGPFLCCCHWLLFMCVCVCEWEAGGDVPEDCCCLAFVFWMCSNATVVSNAPQNCQCVQLSVCVWLCMCTVSCWGYMCGAVCPQGLSPQWPQRRLSQRETEREKEGECLCRPLTPTH